MPQLDGYLEFLAARSRPNTVLAVAYDLRVFSAVVGKRPARGTAADVVGFVTAQHTGAPGWSVAVGRRRAGVSARTVRRRLSSVSGLFGFLHARGDVEANPVPRGLPTRRERQRPRQGVPLVRTPLVRTPRILQPAQVDVLLAALRTWRDRAMAEAMVLGGLRRCEVLGLRQDCDGSRHQADKLLIRPEHGVRAGTGGGSGQVQPQDTTRWASQFSGHTTVAGSPASGTKPRPAAPDSQSVFRRRRHGRPRHSRLSAWLQQLQSADAAGRG
jgi:Phage integrase, N-terminal SAM-like domain